MGLFGVYISYLGQGALSKNTNPDLITLKLKKKQINKQAKKSNNRGAELTNSRLEYPEQQKISNSDPTRIPCVHPQGELLQQLQLTGAGRYSTTFHVQSPTFLLEVCLYIESAVFSLYIKLCFSKL